MRLKIGTCYVSVINTGEYKYIGIEHPWNRQILCYQLTLSDRFGLTFRRFIVPFCLLLSITASAQVTLTPAQVRTVHAIMDSEARLREQAAIDSAQLADYATALDLSEALRTKAEADAVDLRIIATSEGNRADKLFQSVTSQARKTRARSVWAWVATSVALVEGVIIGVAVSVR